MNFSVNYPWYSNEAEKCSHFRAESEKLQNNIEGLRSFIKAASERALAETSEIRWREKMAVTVKMMENPGQTQIPVHSTASAATSGESKFGKRRKIE